MIFIRFVLCFLLLAFFAAALVGTLAIPLYTNNLDSYSQSGKVTVTLWSIEVGETTLAGVNETSVPSSQPIRINYAGCDEFRTAFRVMQAFAIAGTVFGFYSLLISGLQCFCRLKVKLPLLIFVILAFISEVALVVAGGIAYTKTFCSTLQPDGNITAVVFKGAGYDLGVAFYIQVVAAVGFLICLITVPFTQQLWCSNC